jgi:hypothetical protein
MMGTFPLMLGEAGLAVIELSFDPKSHFMLELLEATGCVAGIFFSLASSCTGLSCAPQRFVAVSRIRRCLSGRRLLPHPVGAGRAVTILVFYFCPQAIPVGHVKADTVPTAPPCLDDDFGLLPHYSPYSIIAPILNIMILTILQTAII